MSLKEGIIVLPKKYNSLCKDETTNSTRLISSFSSLFMWNFPQS